MNTSPTVDRPEDTDSTARSNPPDRPAPQPRMQLSGTQLIASALAATTATVAASYLGVAGTVIGAAVASILTVVGNAVYSQTIRRTGDRVRTVVPAVARFAPRPTATSPTAASPIPAAGTEPAPPSRQRNWKLLASACVGVFAAVLFVVTTVELIAGRPLSDVVQGKSGSGTSVLGDQHAKPVEPAPTPVHTPTVTVTPKVVTSTPTVTVIGPAVTKTAPPTATTTPTTPAPTPTPSSSPSGTVTSSGSATGTSSP